MGPRSFDRGNGRPCSMRAARQALASMGPRSFDRGNIGDTDIANRANHGFNGAALVRPRKRSADTRARADTAMKLQWGRARSSAETTRGL